MFDSGVGGLSVLGAFRRLAPQERVVYFADTAWFPYGPRPQAEVRKRAFAITRRLLESDAKLIVVACNTASAAALHDLREAFSFVPFVGMVPGLKPAAERSRSHRVAILATPGTFDGELYQRVADEYGRGTRVFSVPGHDLAALVEAGKARTPEARAAIRDALGPEVAEGADTVVLGCTHYAFLADAIRAEFPGVDVVDTSEAVARRAVDVLEAEGIAAPAGQAGELRLIVSHDRARFEAAMEQLGFAPLAAMEVTP
ncbi:MAG: glutamate racemase [Dehalococcoidia bacterium]